MIELSTVNGIPNPGLLIGLALELTNTPLVVLMNGEQFARDTTNAGIILVTTQPLQYNIIRQFIPVSWEHAIFADTGNQTFLKRAQDLVAGLKVPDYSAMCEDLKSYFPNFNYIPTKSRQLSEFMSTNATYKRMMMNSIFTLKWEVIGMTFYNPREEEEKKSDETDIQDVITGLTEPNFDYLESMIAIAKDQARIDRGQRGGRGRLRGRGRGRGKAPRKEVDE